VQSGKDKVYTKIGENDTYKTENRKKRNLAPPPPPRESGMEKEGIDDERLGQGRKTRALRVG
jgi:hypothetical protein